ncbi:flagellar operon protein [Clostridium sporogenes]|nr:flagellar operon protein [Clostridium sporogenes]
MQGCSFNNLYKNRTIITAMTKEESKDNVFTNIDSAVII